MYKVRQVNLVIENFLTVILGLARRSSVCTYSTVVPRFLVVVALLPSEIVQFDYFFFLCKKFNR